MASIASQKLVRMQEEDTSRLFNRGARRMLALTAGYKTALIEAIRTRNEELVTQALDRSEEPLIQFIQSALLAAHLTGRVRTRIVVEALRRGGERRGLAVDQVFEDAVEFAKRRLNLRPAQIAALEKTYGDQAVKTVVGFTKKTREALTRVVARTIKENIHPSDAVRAAGRALRAAGVSPLAPYQVESVLRTNVQLAYGAARWNAAEDEDMQELLWGWEYATVGDDRVRPNHAAMDGARYPKGDPFWLKNWPPNGWNCRCSTVEIIKGDKEARKKAAREKKVDVAGEIMVGKPEADEGWGFNPGSLFKDIIKTTEPVRRPAPTRAGRR